ncbi:hypothetical protein ACJX0J_033991, partial [Zea mays]
GDEGDDRYSFTTSKFLPDHELSTFIASSSRLAEATAYVTHCKQHTTVVVVVFKMMIDIIVTACH